MQEKYNTSSRKQSDQDRSASFSNADNDILPEDKSKWIKAIFREKMKRIHNPSQSFEGLLEQFKKRFQELRESLEENPSQKIQLSYFDGENDLIEIEDTCDLEQAYKCSDKEQQNKILKFLIELVESTNSEESPKKEVIKEEKSPVGFGALGQQKPGEEERKVEERLQDKISNDMNASQVSVELEDDVADELANKNNEEENKNQKILDQDQIAAEGKIKEMIIPQAPAALVEVLDDKEENKEEGGVFYEEVLNEERAKKPLLLIALQILDPQEEKEKAPFCASARKSSHFKSFFMKMQNFILPPMVSEKMRKQAVLVSEKECYAKTAVPGNVILKWTFENQSTEAWEKHCVIKNHCTDDAYVSPLYSKSRLEPSERKEVIMNVYLPADYHKEKIILLFQFETADGNRFGDAFIGIIDIDLPLNDDREVFSSKPIRQSQMIEENILFAVASKLVDKGYGSFDRCLQVTKACKGNEIEAEEVLSTLIFKEFKKQVE